ncbi:MAG: helix-turn-helix transcriptional regulator [Chloroflexi bacterium]|nr:helix-turn-helix transcriptional regulator [Chloroflexota bacterium]MBI5828125.1 helix-turn-helix transcriptional regulator [Chloroflexota bacterium]
MDTLANLPLTEATLFILLSLAPEPKHGYAIMKDVQALSEERIVLSTGTLYGALKRLLEQRWIRRVNDPSANGDARERKAYALTEQGRRVLRAEVSRLQKLVKAARLRAVEDQG